MFRPSSKSLLALLFALLAFIALSSTAAPLTSEQLATRSEKIQALRQKLEDKRPGPPAGKGPIGGPPGLKGQGPPGLANKGPGGPGKGPKEKGPKEKGPKRGGKEDNDPLDCGFGRITCPVSYNGLGKPVCNFGACKLECPRGLRQFFSRHEEFPSFCA
ncbi:uncharacterized protein JCM6883_005646 [Sporobolomyces salmoneus]|uniref:uncharacterized protein n=1 Tax=Sporobolomyces salmoneus TaxID=183962 RepID=UPI00317C7349